MQTNVKKTKNKTLISVYPSKQKQVTRWTPYVESRKQRDTVQNGSFTTFVVLLSVTTSWKFNTIRAREIEG